MCIEKRSMSIFPVVLDTFFAGGRRKTLELTERMALKKVFYIQVPKEKKTLSDQGLS
jgi:hypothetical protein